MNMKKTFRKLSLNKFRLIAIGLATAAIGVGVGLSQASGNATLTLSPASKSYEINTTFSVTVYENSSDPIHAVQADFSYDASKLQFLNIDGSASAFDTSYPSSGGGGTVKISRANSAGALTGNHVVATVNFKALSGSGTAALSFLSSSAILRTSDYKNVWNGITTGATYSFSTPPASCPSGQTGTPPNCTTPQTTTKTTTTTTTNSTSTPKTNTSSGSAPTSANSASQQSDPAAPVPVDTNKAASSGYFVAIKVISPEGKPVKDAEVSLNKQTVKSDSAGIASFVNVPAGTYNAKIRSVLGESTLRVMVDTNTAPGQVQEFATQVRPKSNILPYVVVPVLALLAAVGLLLFRKRTGRLPWAYASKHAAGTPSAVVTDAQNGVTKPLTIEAIEHQVHSPHVTHPKKSDDS